MNHEDYIESASDSDSHANDRTYVECSTEVSSDARADIVLDISDVIDVVASSRLYYALEGRYYALGG